MVCYSIKKYTKHIYISRVNAMRYLGFVCASAAIVGTHWSIMVQKNNLVHRINELSETKRGMGPAAQAQIKIVSRHVTSSLEFDTVTAFTTFSEHLH